LALSKQLLKKTAEMHHVNDQVLIEELHMIAQQMMSGMMPGAAGGGGGTPNVQPGTGQAGAAAGINNIRGGRPS
jgi:hypothetical protein